MPAMIEPRVQSSKVLGGHNRFRLAQLDVTKIINLLQVQRTSDDSYQMHRCTGTAIMIACI